MTSNKVLLTDDDIIEIKVVGDQTHESVMAMGELVRGYLRELSSRHAAGLVLDDVTRMGITDIPARQAVSQLARTLPYKRAALLGTSNLLMRYGTRLLLKAIGMGGKIRYFEDREAAIRWLKS